MTTLNDSQDANRQLIELGQVEATIAATQSWLATLHERQLALSARLDELTRPDAPAGTPPAPPEPPSALQAIMGPRPVNPASPMIGPGVVYQGTIVRRFTAIDIFVALLQMLWDQFPDQREKMARAMASRGTARRYVARDPADLFHYQPAAFARKHSRPLADGWVVDTNLNRSRILTLSQVAVRAAGLEWNSDVKVFWRPTRLD